MRADLLAIQVASQVLDGDRGDEPRLLCDVGLEGAALLHHDLERVRAGVEGRDHDLGAPGFLECLDHADGRLVPAGHVDRLQLALGVLLEQGKGLLTGILRSVRELLGQLGLEDGDVRVLLVEHRLPGVVADATEAEGLAECVEHRHGALAADGLGHQLAGGRAADLAVGLRVVEQQIGGVVDADHGDPGVLELLEIGLHGSVAEDGHDTIDPLGQEDVVVLGVDRVVTSAVRGQDRAAESLHLVDGALECLPVPEVLCPDDGDPDRLALQGVLRGIELFVLAGRRHSAHRQDRRDRRRKGHSEASHTALLLLVRDAERAHLYASRITCSGSTIRPASGGVKRTEKGPEP